MPENRGLQALEERVIARDLCTLCGACLSLCPYLRSWQGRWVKLDDCGLAEGRCYAYCPRTDVDLQEMHKRLSGSAYEDIEMGPLRRVLMARSLDLPMRQKAQTGGVVSALVDFAIRGGIIDVAVLTQRREDHLPEGRVAGSREEILSCAGSSYVAGSTLEALNRGPWKGEERIGVVAIPCQGLALAKMRTSPQEKRTPIERIELVIGLFCTWALAYKPFIEFLRTRLQGEAIRKMDITPPPERILKVTTSDRTWDVPLDEIRPFIRTTCGVCADMTSEFSDLSVGTVEGTAGWNTVIVRTDRGEQLLDRAEAAGVLETRSLPVTNLEHLKSASLLKKRRALAALAERGDLNDAYFQLSSELIQRILSESQTDGA